MIKRLDIPHHMDDYECMWNGIEDLYMNKMGETLPPNFFFVLSGFGSFCYLKTNKSELKRMTAFGDGRTAKMYEFLAPIAGFKFKFHAYAGFEQAIRYAKKEIESGYPVVLGALDMYYLPYLPKLYHKEHIPFHYVMMIGYDEEERCIYVHDCAREEVQKIPYEELSLAWNCSYPGLSKPNTLCTIRMNPTKSKLEIAQEAFDIRKVQFLNPKVAFLGYKGMEKMIRELPKWKEELSKEDYDRILKHMVSFFGTVPTVPNALKGIEGPDEVNFYGGFDKVSRVLSMLAAEYDMDKWQQAADIFEKGCKVIENIKEVIVAYLTGKKDETDKLTELFGEIKTIMVKGFKAL